MKKETIFEINGKEIKPSLYNIIIKHDKKYIIFEGKTYFVINENNNKIILQEQQLLLG